MDWKEKYRNALLDTINNPPDVRNIIKPYIPSKLYKYGSFNNPHWKEMIYKAQIYLSSAKVFNDPFDCRANFNYKKAVNSGDFRKELLKRHLETEVDSLSEEMVQNIIEDMRADVFVFCFSEIYDSLLMWAHYANNYNGFCIEYDMKQVREYLTDNLYPVLYEKEYIDITDNLIHINNNTGLICNLVKAEEWSYEKEWRIVKYKQKSIYLRKALKAIYLGKNCSDENKDEIIKWAEENNKEVYNIEVSKTEYKLEAKKIN